MAKWFSSEQDTHGHAHTHTHHVHLSLEINYAQVSTFDAETSGGDKTMELRIYFECKNAPQIPYFINLFLPAAVFLHD